MRIRIPHLYNVGAFMRHGLLLLILAATFLLQYCDDDVAEPGPVTHEFVWEVDTLFPDTFQYLGLAIWGTSETNVYVGGHESDHGGRKSLFRYDDTGWNPIDLWRFGLGTIEAISGIDSSNFIVVGDGGVRGHAGRYRNGVWDTLRLPRLRPSVCGVHMVSPTEIYICGVDGVLRHDGTNYTWIVDSSRSVFDSAKGYPFWPRDIRKGADGNVYVITSFNSDGGKYVFRMTMYREGQDTVIDESIWRSEAGLLKTGWCLRSVGMDLLTGNNSAYSVSDGGYTLIHAIDGFLFTGSDIGHNFFALTFKKVMHFNGHDWQDITPGSLRESKSTYPIKNALYLDNTLFLVTQNGYKTLIYRGKHIN